MTKTPKPRTKFELAHVDYEDDDVVTITILKPNTKAGRDIYEQFDFDCWARDGAGLERAIAVLNDEFLEVLQDNVEETASVEG